MKLRLFPRQVEAYFGLFQAAAEAVGSILHVWSQESGVTAVRT